MVLPTARTAMDKKGGQQLQKYIKNVYKVLSKRTPWSKERSGGRLSHLRDRIPSGETRVLLAPGEDGKLDLFQGVKQIRE